MVVIQNTTEPLTAADCTINAVPVGQLLDQLVVEPLVIALQVVVLGVFLDGPAKVALAQRDDLGQTLGFDGMHKPLCICVQIRAPSGQSHCLHTRWLQDFPEPLCE